ncbi:MAG: S8 family serine peptidase [Phycisphaerales bacterium]
MTNRSTGYTRTHNARVLGAIIAASAGAAASAPSFAIAEAMSTICREVGETVLCEWYRGVGGHPFAIGLLPPADQVLTGSRSIIGFINGLFPLSTHEAFDDGSGGSRILAEIQAGAIPGTGANPPPMAHIDLRTRATGVVGAALGNGSPMTPTPLARGVAFTSRAYVASVANFVGSANSFSPNEQGVYAAMLTMCDPSTQSQIPGGGLPGLADTIVFSYSVVGDWEGEGFTARVCDSMASQFGITVIGPTGDSGAGPFPPQQPELAFRTVGSPAVAFNVISVGGQESAELLAALSGPGGADGPDGGGGPGGVFFFEYNNIWTESGRGRGDTRLWRQTDLTQPSGYAVERDSRFAVDIVAPAMALRLPTAEGDAIYSRAERVPDPPTSGDLGSQSTAFAAGLVGGACALLQDGFRALRDGAPEAFPQFQGVRRLHNTVVRAILMNSAEKSQLWTNQGNQGTGNAQRELFTQQALDTSEGAGRLDLHNLYKQFQGRIASGILAEQAATMDSEITSTAFALVRDPGSIGNPGALASNGFDPPFGPVGGGGEPPIGGPGGPGPQLPQGPFGGSPNLRPGPGLDPRIPRPPGEVRIDFAIPVEAIGWDHGRLGLGFLDYEMIQPFIGGRDKFTATLIWNRLERFQIPNIFSGQTLNISAAETALELENLELEFWISDGSGTPGLRYAASEARRQNIEHIFIEQGLPPARGLIRVRWNGQLYDVRGAQPFSDVEFGLAWRLDDNPLPNLPGQNIVFLPGDITGDGAVNFQDLGEVLRYIGTTNPNGDTNGDGVVNFQDLNIILSNFGRTLPAPGTPGQA